MRISFYFDITCPWTWVTSRWLSEVALERRFSVEWRSLSIAMAEGKTGTPEAAGQAPLGHRLQRVVEAVRKETDNVTVGNLYATFGRRWHLEQFHNIQAMEDALAECGLDVRHFLKAADDPAWDTALSESLLAARNVAGDDATSPLISFNALGVQKAFYGPILSSLPKTNVGVRLWDNLTWLLSLPNFYQYKRPHNDVKPDVASTHSATVYV